MNDKKIYGFINDFMFKFVFGERKDRRILICLLNALLRLEGAQKIQEIEIINPFNDREFTEDKLSIVDINACDGEGRLYNIEVQVTPERSYISRVLYYAARLYCRQPEGTESFSKLRRTISISIVDFTIFSQEEELHNVFRLKNTLTCEDLTDILELHFIELKKFHKDTPRNLQTPFEKWLHILKFGDIYIVEKELPEILREEEGIEEAVQKARYANSDKEKRHIMEAREMARRDEITRLQEAREEGIEDVARKMKQKGVDAATIAEYTELSEEEIEKL